MVLPRRFLSLIVDNRNFSGVRSLRHIDLTRQHFFLPTTPTDASSQIPGAEGAEAEVGTQKNRCEALEDLRMESIRLPNPSFSFEACRAQDGDHKLSLGCFPLSDRKVVCTDQCGRAFLFDANTRHVVTLPTLHKPKWKPFSLFIPSVDDAVGGSLFIMEKIPRAEGKYDGPQSTQFEVFMYHKASESWNCQLLPPPPYLREPSYQRRPHKISCYAVIGNGSHICISAEGAGTYCLNTASNTWEEVGKWTLPFQGKVEYVPELKLWFGLSDKSELLAAADLSDMDSQPQLIGGWKELVPPKDWWKSRYSQLVHLGSGRFCIARFFHTRTPCDDGDDEYQNFAVLTGVEVVPAQDGDSNSCGNDSNAGVGLRMFPHISRCHVSDSSSIIDEVF